MRRALLAVGAIGLFGALTSPAFAASTVGHTLTPEGMCSAGFTVLQSQYSAPSDGVITRWDYQAGASNVPQLKFKVGRLVSGDTYSVVGESGVVTPQASTLNHNLVRIPVKAGDLLGFSTVTTGGCDQPNPDFTELATMGDIAPGAQANFSPAGYEMDVSASLEPDADHDGFGDETQDQCPTNGAKQGPCSKKCKHKKKHKSGAVIAKKCKKKHHH
jgi:hypothetical protein